MPQRVLVVDDNQDAADGLVKLIESFGYEAKAVYSGEAAIAEMPSFHPDMALVDIGMPGLNGYETVSQIRERGNVRLIVVAVTGWAGEDVKRRANECGFNLHVAKPMTLEKLQELLALLNPGGSAEAVESAGT